MRFSTLSPTRQRLVRAMQRIRYGRITNLTIRDGEPVFYPKPEAYQDRKHQHTDTVAQPRTIDSDFALKAEVVDLFAEMSRLDNAVILNLEIKEGLPFLTTVDASELL